MMLTLTSLLWAANEPILTGRTFGAAAVPYVRCLTEHQNAVVSKINRGKIIARDEAEAAKMQSQIRAKIVASCAFARREVASNAMKRLNSRSPQLSISERRYRVDRFLKEVDQTFGPLIFIPIAPSVIVDESILSGAQK